MGELGMALGALGVILAVIAIIGNNGPDSFA